MQLAMTEVINLEDDNDSQPLSQFELTQEQKSRAARNKEIALARLQAGQIRETASWSNPLQFCTTQGQPKSSLENLGTPPLYDRPWDGYVLGGGTQQVKRRDHQIIDELGVLRQKLNSYQSDVTEFVSPGEKMMELSEQQLHVLQAIHQGKSVFMTGSAGTGKSYLLRVAIRDLRRMYGDDNVFVTASTGLAASELGGTTINAFAGVGLGKESGQKLFCKVLDRKDASSRWDRAKAVIIDEISMINGEFFDKLAHVGGKMKSVDLTVGPRRGFPKEDAQEKPWGGIQLIVTGDFFQLPPVKPPNPQKIYAFQAECWDSCFDMQVELTQVFRQADSVFVDMLNEIRRGCCSAYTAQVLQSCDSRQCLDNSLGVTYTRLYPHLKDVRMENEKELMALGTPPVVFKATDELRTPNWLGHLNEAASASLSLCVGAQVMLTKNVDTKAGLVNGARGVVVGFSNADDPACAIAQDTLCIPRGFWPVVVFACEEGLKRIVGPQTWSIMDGQLEVANRSQVPLALAWALSVHKCQGMTLDRVETNLVNAFDHGQVYVALSRVKSLNGLRLTGFVPSKIKAHPLVVNFYRRLGQWQQQSGF